MKKFINKFKKLSLSKKLTYIYFSILIIIMLIFLFYINNSLRMYENNQIDTYINNYIKELSNGGISKYIDDSNIKISDLEKKKDNINDGYKYMLTNTKITHKIKDKDEENKLYTYTVFSNNNRILEVTIKKGKEMHRMGLLTFNLLEVKDVKTNLDRGLYYYDIVVPSNFVVKVNGYTLEDKYIKSNDINSEFGNESYDILPTNITYQVNNLIYKPDINITNNNGDKVNYKEENNTITSNEFYTTNDKETAMKELTDSFDVLSLAEKWSLFLTDDLSGNKHGFDSLQKYLIKDSHMWDYAYTWATGIDITFVSNHTLNNPTFTNEKVSDYIIYNDNSFSCLVHLEKNMTVKGNKKVDIMNDRLYFMYYDDSKDGRDNPSWKLVNMKAIAEE